MNKEVFVSIIIPLYSINKRFFGDLSKFRKLQYSRYEVIVVSDQEVDIPKWKNWRVLLTKKSTSGPAIKRDLGLKSAKGEICAFIDDDAYPREDWLKRAVPWFEDKSIVAVGGPGITPKDDNYWEKLSGMMYESILLSGAAQHRFIPMRSRYVDDWPAYNLLVRTNVLRKVGGYGSDYYGGEDTFLCLKLIKIGKIFYDPKVIVYHHRRKLFLGLMSQIANVGLHRGYFAKKFPQTSRKVFYFLPLFLTLAFTVLLIGSLIYKQIFLLFIMGLVISLLMGVLSIISKTSLLNSLIIGIGIICVHLTYGTFFLKGLLLKDLKR